MENRYSYAHETLRIDGQQLCDHAVKFARWQHPAIGLGLSLMWLAPLFKKYPNTPK